jgi:hypothetical protein
MSANFAVACGATGFFSARAMMPWLQPGGTLGATSFYDTGDLKHTLERLVDFDRLNAGMTRFSAGAVNVRTGNFVYFDTNTHKIGPEHVMASGALPPGFPAVEIDGEHYWDGGLVSNTPLQWVIESNPRRQDTLAFQVDLWSSQGALARNLAQVATRHKEIQFSSRTRASTGQFKNVHRVQRALDALLRRLHVLSPMSRAAHYISYANSRFCTTFWLDGSTQSPFPHRTGFRGMGGYGVARLWRKATFGRTATSTKCQQASCAWRRGYLCRSTRCAIERNS